MMYLSRGVWMPAANGCPGCVSHCGTVYVLGITTNRLWQAAQYAPQPVPVGEERMVQKLADCGLVVTTEEPGAPGAYRLLSECILCPAAEEPAEYIFPEQTLRVWNWLCKAGLRLTIEELICLEEQMVLPDASLLGSDGRQTLTERIYCSGTIPDRTLTALMEQSSARDTVVAAVLELLCKGWVMLL